MALTQVNDKCIVCEEKIESESVCYYLTKVKVTNKGRTSAGECGASFGGNFREVKEDKLRIKHLNTRNKYLFHKECLEKIIYEHSPDILL